MQLYLLEKKALDNFKVFLQIENERINWVLLMF